MAAGAWVFPIAMVGFVAFLAAFLAAHPAAEAPITKARPGVVATIEYTEFYGDAGYAAFSTDQERVASGALKEGPAGLRYAPGPFQLRIPNETTPKERTVEAALLGHRVNDTFTTARFANYYGTWREQRTLARQLGALPAVQSVAEGERDGGTPFNYTRFVEFWSRQVGHALRVGDEIACEGALPWACRIEVLDETNLQVNFRRVPRPNASMRADLVFAFHPNTPTPSNVSVVAAGPSEIAFRWGPRVGERFAIVGDPQGQWTAGAYRVDAVGADELTLSYMPDFVRGQQPPPPLALIGEPVWFEITIVGLARA